MDYIAVPIDLIKKTPNDMELGAEIRKLFYEQTQFGGISEDKTHENEN